jgi:hypothetical protein
LQWESTGQCLPPVHQFIVIVDGRFRVGWLRPAPCIFVDAENTFPIQSTGESSL